MTFLGASARSAARFALTRLRVVTSIDERLTHDGDETLHAFSAHSVTIRYRLSSAVLLVTIASPRRPMPRPPERVSASDGATRAAPDRQRLLVVDDNDDIRELYAAALSDAGYDVAQASDGQQALDSIAESKPALVVMDLSMPVLGGWQATKRIKSDAATADIQVIAVTAHATRYGLADIRDCGADELLAKPCLPDDLLRCIRGLLSGED